MPPYYYIMPKFTLQMPIMSFFDEIRPSSWEFGLPGLSETCKRGYT